MIDLKKDLIPQQLNRICEVLGVRISGLAPMLNLPYQTLLNYSNGSREPKWDFLKALYEFGINLDWFLTGQGEMFRADYNRQANAQNAVKQAVTAATAPTAADLSKREVRLCQFVRWWMDTHEPDDQVWFEKQIERAVPEYAEWKKEQ